MSRGAGETLDFPPRLGHTDGPPPPVRDRLRTVPSSPSPSDLSRVLATLAEQRPSLEVTTVELCFLALLELRGRQEGLASFAEEQLADGFAQVCDAVDPSAENVRARATHAIRRLREQRLLVRVDGAGVVRAGEFALSRLGEAIVAFYLEQDVLTAESLGLLTRTLQAHLAELLTTARKLTGEVEWQEQITAPLAVTVAELVGGIERRQRGMDTQQQDFQRQISELLAADWFGALDQCQSLLDSTASTLRELNSILLRDAAPLATLLAELSEMGHITAPKEGVLAIQQVITQIDRICAWGSARQLAWSEYYEYVHRYLQDVVRLDPSRALSQRLRAQLTASEVNQFSLVVAASPPIALLRDVMTPTAPPPVRRPRADRAPKLEEQAAQVSPMEIVRQRVVDELARGASDLAELTGRLLADVPEQEKFITAGRIAQVLSEVGRPVAAAERPWIALGPTLALEQRRVAKEKQSR